MSKEILVKFENEFLIPEDQENTNPKDAEYNTVYNRVWASLVKRNKNEIMEGKKKELLLIESLKLLKSNITKRKGKEDNPTNNACVDFYRQFTTFLENNQL